MDYKNKQLMEKIMFEGPGRYHTKKEGYLNLCSDMNELYAIGLRQLKDLKYRGA